MRSVQTPYRFPLASVKPLERVMAYRRECLSRTRQAISGPVIRRKISPVGGVPLEPFGAVEGLEYLRCPETGSLFLADLPAWQKWAKLLEAVGGYRQSPQAFHSDLAQSRAENVYFPKLEWIQETLRLQGMRSASLLEVTSPPASLGRFLTESEAFSEVMTADEMRISHLGEGIPRTKPVQAVLLFESLDRVDDPRALLDNVQAALVPGGLLFVTALVASGFDMAVLGLRNCYLYPPDRANCFTLDALKTLLERFGFEVLEMSTPGVLDVEIVESHLKADPSIPVTGFERELISCEPEIRSAFQAFLQEKGLSSFARLAARKRR